MSPWLIVGTGVCFDMRDNSAEVITVKLLTKDAHIGMEIWRWGEQ